MYMLNLVVNNSKHILRINIIARSLVPQSPHPTINDNDVVEDESFADHSMNINVHLNGIGGSSMFQEKQRECELFDLCSIYYIMYLKLLLFALFCPSWCQFYVKYLATYK